MNRKFIRNRKHCIGIMRETEKQKRDGASELELLA